MTISNYSDEELEAEIQRRKVAAITKPELLDVPNIIKIRQAVMEYIEFMGSHDYYEDNDHSRWVFEAAVEAFYGKDAWHWLNKIMR